MSSAKQAAGQRKNRVLLVDDNMTNLQVLFQALEQEGYELLVAQSGEEALEIAAEAQPDLILLDINMPGIDGYQTCVKLKQSERTRASVVVFLSARGDTADKVKGLEIGAVDYIDKPFQFEEVLARVRKHLELHARERQLEQINEELEARLGEGFRDLIDEDVERLIGAGESDDLEFKSTLRWNLHSNKSDKRIENACLKTVAAYLNSGGGMLMVGVDDDGKPLGLDADKFPNEDKMLLHLNTLILNHLGGEFAQLIKAAIYSVQDQRVLVVQCMDSAEPVFFRRDNDEYFYVRTGPATAALSPSEVIAYLKGR
ncbi:MAG: response regulator [Verrucomicrobiales bacterium]|nr:response regulator [Verrucomicrobiales bacterium]